MAASATAAALISGGISAGVRPCGEGTTTRSSPGKGSCRLPFRKKLTWIAFSDSDTLTWRSPARLTTSHRVSSRPASGGKATCTSRSGWYSIMVAKWTVIGCRGKWGKSRATKADGELDLPLAADVVEDDVIAIPDAAHRPAGAIGADQRLQGFVLLAGAVGSADGIGHGVSGFCHAFSPELLSNLRLTAGG